MFPTNGVPVDRRNHITSAASRYISDLFSRELPAWACYHTYRHTVDVVRASRRIGSASGLTGKELEIVALAAWFHDAGYCESHRGHEEASARIAEAFLIEHEYGSRDIGRVRRCILATKTPQRPSHRTDKVLCDADMVYLGGRRFFETNELLRRETEVREGRAVSPAAWTARTLEFVAAHRFHTQYGRSRLNSHRMKIIGQLKRQLGKI